MFLTVCHQISLQWLAMVTYIASGRRFFVPIQFTVVEILGFGFAVKSLMTTLEMIRTHSIWREDESFQVRDFYFLWEKSRRDREVVSLNCTRLNWYDRFKVFFLWTLLPRTIRWEIIWQLDNQYFFRFSYRAILYGIVPKMRSIIAKCSRLSCVWKSVIPK